MEGKRDFIIMRYGTLEFRKCTYLCKEPDVPGWEIVKYYKNEYYGKESEYEYSPEEKCYRPKDNPNHRISENLFKVKELCCSIAIWRYNKSGQEYILEFVGSRPLDLSKEEKEWFWIVLEHGEKQLNNYNNE